MERLTDGVTWPLISGLVVGVLGLIVLEYWNRPGTPVPTAPLRIKEQVKGNSRIERSGTSATGTADVRVAVTNRSALKDSPTVAMGASEVVREVDDNSTVEDSPLRADRNST
ncbi:hypothetical protein [Streptomyces cyaneofuscatus]|uniref:hypothetical protein n=1 Tax=Streptomyces cyaneofuscatus TaxID=66883 RepID=UPI0036DD8898